MTYKWNSSSPFKCILNHPVYKPYNRRSNLLAHAQGLAGSVGVAWCQARFKIIISSLIKQARIMQDLFSFQGQIFGSGTEHCNHWLSLFSLSLSPLCLLLLTTSGILPRLKFCFPQYFGITRRYMQKNERKKLFLPNADFLVFFHLLTASVWSRSSFYGGSQLPVPPLFQE